MRIVVLPFLLAAFLFALRGHRKSQDLVVALAGCAAAIVWTLLALPDTRTYGVPIVGVPILALGSVWSTAVCYHNQKVDRTPALLFLLVPLVYFHSFVILLVILVSIGALPPPF